MNLRAIFLEATTKYNDELPSGEKLWQEIEKNYSDQARHYHTLKHLENLILQLEQVKNKILNWDALLFSVFYHDIIYKATKANNEEKSAELAKKRLDGLNVPEPTVSKCVHMILATKGHVQNDDSDINYFTDADLSILGQTWDIYETYFMQIRKEYSVYPDFIYNPGRKKVLDHFLKMDRIYKSDYFHLNLESNARENLAREKQLY